MTKVGLTGGIASGKSHVRRRFADAGFTTVDLDAVAREVVAPDGSAYAAVIEAFGPGIASPDGTIDRKALGARVFADAGERRRLEAITHPRIREAETRRLAALAPGGVAVVDAALLVETGQHLRFARLVVVYCEPAEQLRRLMARDGLSEAAARARLDAQMPPLEKRRFAHFVIDNSGARAETDAQTDAVIALLRALAARPAPPVRISARHAAAVIAAGPREGPPGLSPWDLVDEIAASGGLDLARLARRIAPAHDGPWYLLPPIPDAAPESLAVPVAVWAAAQRPRDEPFTSAAAASVARLTHRQPPEISRAVRAALAAARVLEDGDASALAEVTVEPSQIERVARLLEVARA